MEGCRVSSCQSDSLGFLVHASAFQANAAILQQFASDAQPFERTACHHAMRHPNEKYQSSPMIRAPAGCSVSWKSEHLMIMLQTSWLLVCEAMWSSVFCWAPPVWSMEDIASLLYRRQIVHMCILVFTFWGHPIHSRHCQRLKRQSIWAPTKRTSLLQLVKNILTIAGAKIDHAQSEVETASPKGYSQFPETLALVYPLLNPRGVHTVYLMTRWPLHPARASIWAGQLPLQLLAPGRLTELQNFNGWKDMLKQKITRKDMHMMNSAGKQCNDHTMIIHLSPKLKQHRPNRKISSPSLWNRVERHKFRAIPAIPVCCVTSGFGSWQQPFLGSIQEVVIRSQQIRYRPRSFSNL